MEAEEPSLALDSVEGRVPFHCLAHLGDGARNERVEAPADVALPPRHRRDVGLDGGVAVGLRDLRIAPGEKGRLPRDILCRAFLRALPAAGSIECDRRADERLERLRVDLLAFADVDRAPHLS